MTEATLSITNPDELLALFGPRDQHLRKLRRLFDVSITQRDGRVRISGEDTDVQRATRALEKLQRLSRKKGELSAGDVEVAASEEGATVEGAGATKLAGCEEIEIQHAGRRIKPRTPGQVTYVDAIRSYDLTFATGLRSFLRHDPDVIMVGEIRDRETAEIAITASLTGHLVLSTVHTNDAAGAITRLVDMGVEPFLLSSSLIGVLAQRLVRTLCTDCRVMQDADASECRFLGVEPTWPPRVYHPGGCDACGRH